MLQLVRVQLRRTLQLLSHLLPHAIQRLSWLFMCSQMRGKDANLASYKRTHILLCFLEQQSTMPPGFLSMSSFKLWSQSLDCFYISASQYASLLSQRFRVTHANSRFSAFVTCGQFPKAATSAYKANSSMNVPA